jgi:hypothetical protein
MKRRIGTQELYISSIPKDIRDSFLENAYTNIDGAMIDHLSRLLLGDLYEDVAWFLYECNGRCNKIWFEDREYLINSTEDYLNYAKRELFKDVP